MPSPLSLVSVCAALLTAQPGPAAEPPCCRVLELRQYTLEPGGRDVLIDLFEREFIESQEALGVRLVGQFQDTHAAERFVWVRGFPDMDARAKALAAFYGGPVWKAHRTQANATMVDSSDVLLLRPVETGAGFLLADTRRPPPGASERPSSLVVATLYFRAAPVDAAFLRFFTQQVQPLLSAAGAPSVALLQSEPAPNSFPALPVREGEHVLVSFARFASRADYEAHRAQLSRSSPWTQRVLPALRRQLKAAPQVLELQPTPRSQLR